MIIVGDCLEALKKLESESVHCCVTSPPYYGLRDYLTSKWEGGDDPKCEHEARKKIGKQETNKGSLRDKPFNVCPKCGAVRVDKQIGLEDSPEEYVDNLISVFREIKRVLRNDGTLWLNLGDSYNGSGGSGGDYAEGGVKEGQPKFPGRKINGLKPKDLIGIPWRVAFALQKDGWYLRQDIIWHKPNPMPESAADRCTKAHEYVFLMAKSPRYFYDAESIKEPLTYPNEKRRPLGSQGAWEMDGRKQRENGGGEAYEEYPSKRNKRSVWTITTKPFRGSHFATFPPDLIEPMIMAGCPKNGIVIDPFFGSGTVGLVAKYLGRDYIGIELNPEYAKMAERRINSPSGIAKKEAEEKYGQQTLGF